MAIGCAEKSQTTTDVHAKLLCGMARQSKKSGVTLRIMFFLRGATSLIQAAEIFEKIDSK